MGRYQSSGIDFPSKSLKLDENMRSSESEGFYSGSCPCFKFWKPVFGHRLKVMNVFF